MARDDFMELKYLSSRIKMIKPLIAKLEAKNFVLLC